MAQSDQNQNRSEGERTIDERLLGDRDASQQEIVEAANQGFAEDQEQGDHPTRIKRNLNDGDDPSHSVGSNRQGPGARDLGQDK